MKKTIFLLKIQPASSTITLLLLLSFGDVVLKSKGVLFVLIAAIMWGGVGIFVRNLERLGVSSMNIVFMRSFFTVIILAAVMLIKSPAGFHISIKDIPLFAANGIFSVVMFTFCYYMTISLSTLSVAAVLMYTAPMFVMIISMIFFKEKLTVRKAVALVLSFAGCALVSGVVGTSVRISFAALIYGLLTGFGYALYTVFGSRLILRGYKTLPIIFYTFVFAVIGAAVVLAVQGNINFGAYKAEAWFWALLMAIFNTVLPYLFYTLGLKLTNTSTAPIIASVEPVSATVVGLFFGEKLTLFGTLGIVLVLCSVVLININLKQKTT